MMTRACILFVAALSLPPLCTRAAQPMRNGPAVPQPAGPSQGDEPLPKGTLVIAGGALRYDNAAVWSRIVDSSGGRGATVAVIPYASGNPDRVGGLTAAALRAHGAEPFVVPADPNDEIVARVKNAGGVFFTGGEQQRIINCLCGENGTRTPLLEAVWHVYRDGGMVAGTSAGAAVMSRIMYRDARVVLATLLHGVELGKEIDRGLGFLDDDWFIDQHCLTRGRFARALVAMHDQGFKFGLGIDENTALVVSRAVPGDDLRAEVIGYQGAILLDLSEAEHDSASPAFNLRKIRLSYLDRGDAINLRTRIVTPAAEKQKGVMIEPRAPTFKPEPDEPLYFNDILGNSTVLDAMRKLLGSRKTEAVGLAFDGARARRESVSGFEFRLYRDDETRGWYTSAWGGEAYTVLNIRLDIRPVRFTGPIYRAEDHPDHLTRTSQEPRD